METWFILREIYHIGYMIFPKILFTTGIVGYLYVIVKLLFAKTGKVAWTVIIKLLLFLLGGLFVVALYNEVILLVEILGLACFVIAIIVCIKGTLKEQHKKFFVDVLARSFFLISGLILFLISSFEGVMWAIERFRLLLLSLV